MPLHRWKGARSPRRIAAIALAGLALAAAACSSASGSSTTTTSGSGSSTTPSGPVTLRLGYLTNLTHASASGRYPAGDLHEEPAEQRDAPDVDLQRRPRRGDRAARRLARRRLTWARTRRSPPTRRATAPSGSSRVPPRVARRWWSRRRSPPPPSSRARLSRRPSSGNTQDVALRTWLKKQGLTFPGPNGGSGEVTILPEDNSTTLTSFEAGSIAGAWVPEPWVARMVSRGPRPRPGQREDPVAEWRSSPRPCSS